MVALKSRGSAAAGRHPAPGRFSDPRRELIGVERDTCSALSHEGRLRSDALRLVDHEFDLDEADVSL
jgi:hypothetical protein